MMQSRAAFTIIEILVASTLFTMLMGVAAFAFQRLNEGGQYAQRIIELHERSDSIIRLMEEDMRALQQTVAIHIDTDSALRSFTFMRQTTNQNDAGFGGNDIVGSLTGLGQEEAQRGDVSWVKWQWGDGDIKRAISRPHFTFNGWTGDRRYTDNTKQYIKNVNFATSGTAYYGMHRNGITPTPQKQFLYFYGNGNFRTVNSDGSVNAQPGDQIHVYKKVAATDFNGNNCVHFDELTSKWRVDNDFNHWYTTYLVGNDEQLSNQAFAVMNADGKTFNKDRLNLEGCDDNDGNGNYYYPDRTQALFTGVEFMEIKFFKRNGTEIDAGDDDDTINDGATTIDINGIADDASGVGIEKRPVVLRITFLLHSIDRNEIDEGDYDNDGDDTEYLVQAVRDMVAAEGLATRQEQIDSFKKHAQGLSASSVVVNYAIKLGL